MGKRAAAPAQRLSGTRQALGARHVSADKTALESSTAAALRPAGWGDAAAASGPLLSVPMPRRRGLELRPRDYVAAGQTWPYGTLKKDTPGVVFFAQSIVKQIEDELERDKKKDKKLDKKLTVKQLAEDAKVSMQTVYDFLNGDSWGTLTLIYSLERALQQPLWSKDHLSPKWDIMVRDHNAS